MQLTGYGITLRRLTEHDLELVRQKRNSEQVRPFMQFREEITPDMQRAWFVSIDNEHNNYFLIIHNGLSVGLISGAEIDWEKMETNNGGLFIWESSLWGTPVPLYAALLLTELSFLIGFRKSFVRVLPGNKRAILFNTQIGYERVQDQPESDLHKYVLTPEKFFSVTTAARTQVKALFPEKFRCVIDDPQHATSRKIIAAYQKLRPEDQAQLDFTVE